MLPGTSKALDKRLSYLEGDYFPGLVFNIRVNGEPPDSDVASCSFTVRKNRNAEDILKQTTNGSGITIHSANLWTFELEEDPFTGLPAGEYFWSFRTVRADSVSRTYINGTVTVGPPA
jgi:hypothetical protein